MHHLYAGAFGGKKMLLETAVTEVSYRQLGLIMWVLGTNLGMSTKHS